MNITARFETLIGRKAKAYLYGYYIFSSKIGGQQESERGRNNWLHAMCSVKSTLDKKIIIKGHRVQIGTARVSTWPAHYIFIVSWLWKHDHITMVFTWLLKNECTLSFALSK